jgi:hypothetical protein
VDECGMPNSVAYVPRLNRDDGKAFSSRRAAYWLLVTAAFSA